MAAILLLAVCLFVGCKKKQPQYGGDIEKQWNAPALAEVFNIIKVPVPGMQIGKLVTGGVIDISSTTPGHIIMAVKVPKLAQKQGVSPDIYFYDNMVMDQEIEIQKTSNTEGTIKSKAAGDIMTYKNLTDTSVEFTGQGATNQKCDVMPSKVTLMGVDNLPFQIISLFKDEPPF